MILKLERFSHLSGLSFGLGSLIGPEALSLVLSLRDDKKWERATWKRATQCPKGGFEVNAI